MNTFNNLVAVEHGNKVSNSNHILDKVADLGMVWPVMTSQDKHRTKAIVVAIKSALQSADHHLANTSHWVRSGDTWVSKDRLGSLTNAIAKFEKLNAGVLDGGVKLKTALIELAWLAYAKLEVNGTDNAHFVQWDVPADETGREDIYDVRTRSKKAIPELPDSKLAPADQWLALELAETFTRRQLMETKPVNAGKATRCKRAASPLPTAKPFGDLQWHPERVESAQGSGLPFDVPAAPMPQADKSAAHAMFDPNWDQHPRAVEVDNSVQAQVDNLGWLIQQWTVKKLNTAGNTKRRQIQARIDGYERRIEALRQA